MNSTLTTTITRSETGSQNIICCFGNTQAKDVTKFSEKAELNFDLQPYKFTTVEPGSEKLKTDRLQAFGRSLTAGLY